MRFSERFTLLFGALAICLAVLLTWTTTSVIDRAVEGRARERLEREADLLAAQIAAGPADLARIDSLIRLASKSLGVRATVIAPDGVVVDDSDVAPADIHKLENHGTRPEVVQAHSSRYGFSIRHSATLGFDLFYLARPLPAGKGFLRLAIPYSQLRHLESKYDWLAGGTIFLACALLFTIGSVAGRALTGPIRDVAEAALAVSRGDLEREPPAEGPREIVELSSAIRQMKTSLLDAAERAEAERRLADTVFQTLPDGVAVVDRHWKILDANPAFGRLLNSEAQAGRSLGDVLRDRELFDPFERAVQQQRPVEQTVERPDERTWIISAHPLSGVGGAAAVGIIHDVTEMRRNESLRRRFVADVSHELRTPIASILAASETLAGLDPSDPEVPHLVEVVQRQARRTQELIEDLTDLSLIESGLVPLELQPVDLRKLAEEVAADYQPAARERSIAIEVGGQDGVSATGDPRRVGQILRNLVDNAIKFSPDGAVVTIDFEQEGPDVVLSVRDAGVGIAPKEHDRIFQRFYQVDRSRSKSRPGTGLGLAIVKHLANLHGATVTVESAPGAGSRFSVRFPAQRR